MANAISACVHWPVRRGTSLDATFAWGRLRLDMVCELWFADLSVRARLRAYATPMRCGLPIYVLGAAALCAKCAVPSYLMKHMAAGARGGQRLPTRSCSKAMIDDLPIQ